MARTSHLFSDGEFGGLGQATVSLIPWLSGMKIVPEGVICGVVLFEFITEGKRGTAQSVVNESLLSVTIWLKRQWR